MEEKLTTLILNFGLACVSNRDEIDCRRFALQDDGCARDFMASTSEFSAIEAHITGMLTDVAWRGVQAEREWWKDRTNSEGGHEARLKWPREGHADIPVRPEYMGLLMVLVEALNQAQHGKGAERHNLSGDTPFERQRMQTVSELVGSPDGMVYQAIKKLTEGMKLPTQDRQIAELLGAINYIAGIVVYLRAQAAEGRAKDIDRAMAEGRKQAESEGHKTAGDPFVKKHKKVNATGWIANSVVDLFDVLSGLSQYMLSPSSNKAESLQLLGRVWRLNSPLLKAIRDNAKTIDATAMQYVDAIATENAHRDNSLLD